MRTYTTRRPAAPISRAPGRAETLPIALHAALPRLLRDTTPATRARVLASLQRSAGNTAVRSLIATVGRPRTAVAAGGGSGASVSLHGDTSSDFDGGQSSWKPRSMARAKNCTDCPEDNPCLHAVGTFSVAYKANVTIVMPDMPDGLTECQQKRVSDFLRNVLAPHEREHARRFHTYDGTTRHAIDFTGCGTDALNAHLQEIHDNEETQRQADARAKSAAIDPFNRPINLDCT